MSFNTDQQQPSSKQPYIPLYALPSTLYLSPEDDWTHIKDRKVKKRIQNRVAQRTYRQRMKARIAELQARVDQNEGSSRRQSADTEEPFAAGGLSSSVVDIQENHQPAADAVAAPLTQPTTRPAKDGAHPQSQPQAVQQSLHKPSPPVYDASKTMNTPPYPQQQAFAQMYARPENPPVVNVRPYDNKSVDSSMQLPRSLAGEGSNPDGVGFPQPGRQSDNAPPSRNLEVPLMTNGRGNEIAAAHFFGRAVHGAEETLFTPDSLYGQPLLNHHSDSDSWKPDNPSRFMWPGSFATDPLDAVTQPNPSSTMSHIAAAGMASPSDSAGSFGLLDGDATINERFEYIMECVDALKFDNFDALVIAYYAESFTESPPLANEQRVSRNRRLPKAIAEIFNASKEWSAWERRGFLEEILRSTESMLVMEKKEASSAVNAALAPLVLAAEADALNAAGMAKPAQALQALKKTIPRELPNLWTIMIALASSNGTAWQHDCSGSALAATLVLYCPGRVPKEQLLALIGACL
ncbi:hypothetical protein BDV10DRAFT_189553 [Aspergillus recurvatus]